MRRNAGSEGCSSGLLLLIVQLLASCLVLWVVHLQLRPEQTPQLSNQSPNFSQETNIQQASCQSLFSEQNPTEHWIYRTGCPLPADWSWFLKNGTSSTAQNEIDSLKWKSISNASIQGQSSLFLNSSDLLGGLIAIHLHFTGKRFPSPLQLHLVSFHGKQSVQLKELHRTGALHTAPLGTLESGFWSGLEFRNEGHEELAFNLDALCLQMRSPAELLNKQVIFASPSWS
jgi:hypothetical protein